MAQIYFTRTILTVLMVLTMSSVLKFSSFPSRSLVSMRSESIHSAKTKRSNETIRFSHQTMLHEPFKFCHDTPSRCAPLDRSRWFSFLHVSKSGGTSWILELRKMELGSLFPRHEVGAEMGLLHQNYRHTRYDHLSYHLASMRSPRHHAWSLWSECRFDDWGRYVTQNTTFPRSGQNAEEDVRDFTLWMNHFVKRGPHGERLVAGERLDYYNCYHPANYQSRAFLSDHRNPHGPRGPHELVPNIPLANQTYFYFDFMAVTEFFHESKCLLFYRTHPRTAEMQSYLDDTCHCRQDDSHDLRNHTDVKSLHHQGRRRRTMSDLDQRLLDKIATATTTDTVIYRTALRQFMREISWLEASLQRRVMCDAVLAKWEHELAYLGVSVTSLYHLPQQRVSNQHTKDGAV